MTGKVGFNPIPNNQIKTMNSVVHKANTRGHADLDGSKQITHLALLINAIRENEFWSN